MKKNSLRRILKIKQSLKNGEKLSLDELCVEYDKHRETIKRDMGMIRDSLAEEGIDLIYNHQTKVYEIEQNQQLISSAQIFAILSVLHGSRTFNKEEMKQMEDKLSRFLAKDARQRLHRLIASYQYHYRSVISEPLLPLMETLLNSIIEQTVLEIVYVNAKFEEKQMRIAPYTVIFADGYFYVVVRALHIEEDTFYNLRIDRMVECNWTNEKFVMKHHGNDYFKPGEYANMSAKMFSGEKQKKIKIRVRSNVVSYFEDRFPIYTLLEKTDEWSTYEFVVMNEEGALFWILSERDWVEVIGPPEIRAKMAEITARMAKIYEKTSPS